MKQKEKQEIFDFFTDNLTKASQEFQNKVKESKIYAKIQKELDKYIRIPVSEFPTKIWFLENKWQEAVFFPGFYEKKDLMCSHKNENFIFQDQDSKILFQGKIQKEKDFLTIERLVGI